MKYFETIFTILSLKAWVDKKAISLFSSQF